MDTILVTGAGGLLGSHVVRLLAERANVLAGGHSAPAAAGARVTPVSLDLSRPLDRTALPARLDAVVYLAQSNRFREFPEAADDVFQVNTARVLDLLDFARTAGATRFLYASTGSVYAPSTAPLTEDSPLVDREAAGFYAASKLAAEILVRSYAPVMAVTILRFFFIYGPGQKDDMLVPRLARSVREGRPVALQGEEGLAINPIHASDAARAVDAALRLEGHHTLNVAGPEVLSLKAICRALGAAAGKDPVFETTPALTAPALIADTARMDALLGPAKIRFAEAAAELVG